MYIKRATEVPPPMDYAIGGMPKGFVLMFTFMFMSVLDAAMLGRLPPPPHLLIALPRSHLSLEL
jgi:hypothetical protein